MPFTGTVWESRASGSNLNGGGFNSGVSGAGTDYSQQDAAQLVIADLAAVAAHNTNAFVATSATGGLTAAMVGNVLAVNSGSAGWSRGRFMITGYTNANTITIQNLDGLTTVITNATCSGGAARVGGAVKALDCLMGRTDATFPANIIRPLDKVWVKSGVAACLEFTFVNNQADETAYEIEGYTTTRGDGAPTRPVMQMSSTATNFLQMGNYFICKNVEFDGNGNCDDVLYVAVNGKVLFKNSRFTGGNDWGARIEGAGPATFDGCVFDDNGTNVVTVDGNTPDNGGVYVFFETPATFYDCDMNGNRGCGMSFENGCHVERCRIWNNRGYGLYQGAGLPLNPFLLVNCDVVGNDVSGFRSGSTGNGGDAAFVPRNNLFVNNGAGGSGYGEAFDNSYDFSAPRYAARYGTNGFYGNASGAVYFLPTVNNVILTANPYTDSPNGDFTKNAVAGGGLAAIGVGVPAFLDLGSRQTQGGPGSCSSDLQGLIDLWRELTNQQNTTVIPDSRVRLYITQGLYWLNRRIRYYVRDEASPITPSAGTGQYTLPADYEEMVYVYFGAQELKKTDLQEAEIASTSWRSKTGTPAHWLVLGNVVHLIPAPNAAAAVQTLTLRYVATPPDLAANGAAGLSTQSAVVPVYYGAYLYTVCHPDDASSPSRAGGLLAFAEREADLMAQAYASRRLLREPPLAAQVQGAISGVVGGRRR